MTAHLYDFRFLNKMHSQYNNDRSYVTQEDRG